MSENILITIRDTDELNKAFTEWNELQPFTMSAHYKCPQCNKRLSKIDIPYRNKRSRIRYKPLYRCIPCNIFLQWERRVRQDG